MCTPVSLGTAAVPVASDPVAAKGIAVGPIIEQHAVGVRYRHRSGDIGADEIAEDRVLLYAGTEKIDPVGGIA